MCRKGNKKVAQSSKKKNPSNVIYEEASRYPAKITHNHLFNIYHLNEICGPNKSHPNKFKNTNCTNPFCLLKIGLERWEKFRKPPKTDEPKRDKPRDIQLQPCGLYNNANLCYLNSFLQIWYHNPHFRHFVFSYASVPTFVNPKNSSGAVIKVQKIMERLQAVFFALEVSPFEACDAVRLAEALMLQDGQQDVSEFHTLFFAFLEKQLEGHPSLPGFKKVHEKINFRMKQIIECPCKRKKVTETIVSGLHVSPEGCTNVTEMLKKCFEPAPLHGYTCPECNEESITHMRNEVGTLPPVLMIQITRVSIDHRKDRTAIIYPRELNESTLLKGSKGNHKYHLIAVCVHDGQAASSGHYYDYIYDTRRKKWFHFNDATVKSIKPPGVETEDDVIKPTSDMRGCYLLLYRRDTDLDADEDEEIPYNKLPKRAYVIEKRVSIVI
uniref:Ubiquitin carboxyl-terminal hydrolase n=1 Tax=Panagrolaimus sp. JU765 TaxID=591449 RepID=A0AC34R6P6_9BILA